MSGGPGTVEDDADEEATVTAHECNPDRTVFTERDNSEGWIATDLTVSVDR